MKSKLQLKKQTDFNKAAGMLYVSLENTTSVIKCISCHFDIFVYPNEYEIVCKHCKTVNNLRTRGSWDVFL